MRFAAMLFDAYGTLFDVHSVAALAEQLCPGQGEALSRLWRAKQLEYTHLRTLAGQYKSFWEITRDALDFAADALALELGAMRREHLMNQYACLAAFPEVKPVLRALRESEVTLGVLSNGTPQMIDIAVKSAQLTGLLDPLLSVDAVRIYKTAPEAYALGCTALRRPAEEILFVSANAWDIAGAGWFGYPTYWINRDGGPLERLSVQPDGEGRSLTDLLTFLSAE